MEGENHEYRSKRTPTESDHRDREVRLEVENSDAPRVGDIFLSRRTADYPVEWLVVDDNGGRRFQVVLLDVHPFAGSRDVERSAPNATGVVRCDLDEWLDTGELETELRTGALTAAEMAEVLRRRQAIAEQTLVATLREEEVDTDPEYRLWRNETLRPALNALGQTDDSNIVPDRWWRWRPRIAVAALLALAMPLAWQIGRLYSQLHDERARRVAIEREYRSQKEELNGVTDEVGRLETALRETREGSEKALAELKNDFAEHLERIFDDSVVVNLPSFVLGGKERDRASRGLPEVINPGSAARFTLSLEVTDPEPYSRYRLRLLKNEGERLREVWSNDQMVTFNGKWLRLDLPTDLLDPGSVYELRVDGMNAEGATALKERYRIQFNR